MATLPLQITAGALPLNISYTPQQFAEALAERLQISTEQAFALFTYGAVLPPYDTGPHFLTTESTWYYFDTSTGSYQPIRLNSKSLRYIISNTEPDSDDYDIWYRVAADGTPLDIRKYQAGQWVAFPVDYDNITNKPNLAPVGEMILWPTNVPPQDFLVCNGQAVLRGQYAELFNVIGVTFGSGDGSTTFNLPDLRGRTAVGVGTSPDTDANPTAWTLAQKRGEETHELTATENAEHQHLLFADVVRGAGAPIVNTTNGAARAAVGDGNNDYSMKRSEDTDATLGLSGTSGTGAGHNNIQPSLALNYIIRYQN
jgi:microcystin-dependent protein